MDGITSSQDDRSSQEQPEEQLHKTSSSSDPSSNGLLESARSSTPVASPTGSAGKQTLQSDPMDPLEAFDWSALEESYHGKMESFAENEEAIVEEFRSWLKV